VAEDVEGVAGYEVDLRTCRLDFGIGGLGVLEDRAVALTCNRLVVAPAVRILERDHHRPTVRGVVLEHVDVLGVADHVELAEQLPGRPPRICRGRSGGCQPGGAEHEAQECGERRV
jgi:hypothetical protein